MANVRQMLDAPETLRNEDVLAAQQQVGNQVVQRILGPEARDAAVTDEQGNLHSDIASKIQQKRGSGVPLPDSVQREAGKTFGMGFEVVRVHTDETADKLSRTINARAFTIGSDIFFKSGVFAPDTSKGRETLMHELTHVVQQTGSSKNSGGKLKLGSPGTAMEKQAEQKAMKACLPSQSHTSDQQPVMQAKKNALVQRDDDQIDNPLESDAVRAGFGAAEMGVHFGTQGNDASNSLKGSGKESSGWAGLISGSVSTGYGLGNAINMHKKRSDPNMSGTGKELAWKAEKDSSKKAGTGLLSTAASESNIISGGLYSAGKETAAKAADVWGAGFGVGVSGVSAARNLYGMGRSAHKARQLGGWTGKGGIVGEMEKENDADKGLIDAAKFAHTTKSRTAGMKAIGTVGSGLGVAGGALALASNPAGWAVSGAAAAVGVGVGAYKLGRGAWKRSHRRGKLGELEKSLGIEDEYKKANSKGKRFKNWITGKDIDERRKSLQGKKEEVENMASDPRLDNDSDERKIAQEKLDAFKTADSKGKGNLFERTMKTKKHRVAGTLVEHLKKESGDGKTGEGYAQRLGNVLGVTSKDGKLTQSRGWKKWKGKEDLDINDPKAKNEEIEELFKRKLGSSG